MCVLRSLIVTKYFTFGFNLTVHYFGAHRTQILCLSLSLFFFRLFSPFIRRRAFFFLPNNSNDLIKPQNRIFSFVSFWIESSLNRTVVRIAWRKMCVIIMLSGLFLCLFLAGFSSAAIRNISLYVDPPSVRRGQHARFVCSYDLDKSPLYSVKFYRGNFEFYRYSPSQLPPTKNFQFVGFNVDVSIQIFFHSMVKKNFIHFLFSH